MCGLPQKASEIKIRKTDVDEDVPAIYIVGQISILNTVFDGYKRAISPALTTKEMREAIADDVLCQTLSKEVTKDGMLVVKKVGLL